MVIYMEHFIDRKQEMETLQAEYERKGCSLVILYGRRRTGKTSLITEFIQDKNALFFLASEESEAQNRSAFKDKAADFINSALLREAGVSSWDAIFAAIMERQFTSKPIIVIDEFQYIGKSNPASGVYLRGRYECQVLDSYGKPVNEHNMAAYYGRVVPKVAAEKPANEWQHVSVTLYKRHIFLWRCADSLSEHQT